VIFAQFMLFLFIGVGLWVLHKEGIFSLPQKIRSDEVFGTFIVQMLPVGLRGLVVAAVLAAAMSTLSASLNSSATAFVVDFYRPLRPEKGEEHYLKVSRGMTAFWGLAQVGVALATLVIDPQRGVITKVLTVAGFTTGIILGLFILGSLPRAVRSGAAVVGVLTGAATVTLVWRPWTEPLAAWPWYAVIGTSTTVVVAWMVNKMLDFYQGAPA
jgi:Na+/proline symporter